MDLEVFIMKRFLALILAAVMVFSLTACSSEEPTQAASAEQTTEAPTTAAPTTEAPTTAAPTTEAPTTAAPTTEAPTTEAATQGGTVDADKAAFYADYKNNVGKFSFKGEDIRTVQSYGGESMEMVTAHNVVAVMYGGQEATMLVNGNKLYVHTVVAEEKGGDPTDTWYVADIPEGEDPLADFGGSTESYTYEDDMVMEYMETVEVDGVKYDVVKVTSTSSEEEEGNDAIFWFDEATLEVWKLEMEMHDEESDSTVSALMEFFTNDEITDVPANAQEIGHEEATMQFALAMMGILYGDMDVDD